MAIKKGERVKIKWMKGRVLFQKMENIKILNWNPGTIMGKMS